MSSWFLTQLITGGFPSQRDSNLKSVSLVPDSSHHRECQRGGAETIQSGLAVSKSGSHFNTFNTLRPRQNGQHFPNYIFKCIFFNENIWISIEISLKFVPQGPISNILALVQIMALRQLGDKPLSEPMMVGLLTHICVSRPQWVNALRSEQAWLLLQTTFLKVNGQ